MLFSVVCVAFFYDWQLSEFVCISFIKKEKTMWVKSRTRSPGVQMFRACYSSTGPASYMCQAVERNAVMRVTCLTAMPDRKQQPA